MRVGVFNDFVIDYVDTVSLRHYVGMVVGSMDSGQCVHVVMTTLTPTVNLEIVSLL